MNIPVFEKLAFNKVDINSIRTACSQVDLGSKPFIIDPGTHEINDLLENLQEVLEELGIHPLFPYPIYIATPELESHPFFPLIPSERLLSEFWPRSDISRGRSRFDGKNKTISEKLKAINLFERHQHLKLFAIKHKMVFSNSKEIDFYKRILESHHE